MSRQAKRAIAIGIFVGVVLIGALMYFVTVFLFDFSSGQSRMGPVVEFGALTVIATTLLAAAAAWKIRSPAAASNIVWFATAAAWVVAIFVEWRFSYVLGAG
jgi:hypothetical protein